MLLEVSEKTVSNAMHCKKNFDCLKKDKQVCCKVENCISKKVFFINCADNHSCNYKLSFGNSYLCTCAVRKEIFNKHGV